MPGGLHEVAREDLAEPAGKFLSGATLERMEIPVRLQECFLDDVGRVDFALQVGKQLSASKKSQVVAEMIELDRQFHRSGFGPTTSTRIVRVRVHGSLLPLGLGVAA